METTDNLGKYMKKLPREVPSDNFTRMVMDRVRTEAQTSPSHYNPLISRQSWVLFSIVCIVLVVGSALLGTYFPGSDHPAGWISLFSADYSGIWKPVYAIFEPLKSIPVSYFGGLAAISLLVTADRLFTQHAHK